MFIDPEATQSVPRGDRHTNAIEERDRGGVAVEHDVRAWRPDHPGVVLPEQPRLLGADPHGVDDRGLGGDQVEGAHAGAGQLVARRLVDPLGDVREIGRLARDVGGRRRAAAVVAALLDHGAVCVVEREGVGVRGCDREPLEQRGDVEVAHQARLTARPGDRGDAAHQVAKLRREHLLFRGATADIELDVPACAGPPLMTVVITLRSFANRPVGREGEVLVRVDEPRRDDPFGAGDHRGSVVAGRAAAVAVHARDAASRVDEHLTATQGLLGRQHDPANHVALPVPVDLAGPVRWRLQVGAAFGRVATGCVVGVRPVGVGFVGVGVRPLGHARGRGLRGRRVGSVLRVTRGRAIGVGALTRARASGRARGRQDHRDRPRVPHGPARYQAVRVSKRHRGDTVGAQPRRLQNSLFTGFSGRTRRLRLRR